MKRAPALLLLAIFAAPTVHAQCYTVLDGGNRIVYQARKSPVDMSRPLHETLPEAFPGGHLIFDNVTQECDSSVVIDTRKATKTLEVVQARQASTLLARKPHSAVVITEMHNPPLVAVQEGGRMSVQGFEP